MEEFLCLRRFESSGGGCEQHRCAVQSLETERSAGEQDSSHAQSHGLFGDQPPGVRGVSGGDVRKGREVSYSQEKMNKALKLIAELPADKDWFIAAETGISIQQIARLRKELGE